MKLSIWAPAEAKKACEERGTGRVYLDFLLKLYANLKERGFTTQFWGDIILQHPELVEDLPRDSIALEWGYEGSHPFAEHGQKFAASGVPFYVCPGTSSWNTLVGKTDNALANLLNAAINGKKYGAIGYLVTDWGDNGHWQTLPVSFLGFGAAAAYSWACDANQKINLAGAVSRFAFDDPSGAMGRLAFDLGNEAQKTGMKFENSTALFQMLSMSLPEISRHPQLAADPLVATLEAIDAAMSHLRKERMTRPDANLIREEFLLGAQMARHACQRGLLALRDARAPLASDLRQDMQEILTKYRAIWLRRNRPGGLEESVRRLEDLMMEYQS